MKDILFFYEYRTLYIMRWIPPDFSLDLDINPSEKGSQVALAVNAQGLSLDKFGDYTTKVFMDDEEKESYSFSLIKK